jgi:serine/threonine protein kinase/tetratricopeptide (TPR) repeat protein
MTAREIVAEALAIDPERRAGYLRHACGGDRDLLKDAQALLRARAETVISPAGTAMAPSAGDSEAAFELGTFIGPYKLAGQLGEGGMGVVYRAQQLQPIHREVALKIIKPGMDSKQVIARFESERQALAMMEHPNIARVFDAGATPTGRPYFVMEWVDGIPIGRYCDSKCLSVRQRIELFLGVCQAIQHAHQKGIIHRDIKPSNILVAEKDGKPAPKVIDFGLAKALRPDPNGDERTEMMTELGTVMGTLAYMSPEQADLLHRDIDTRSDIYSLGAVLYELLTGTTPLGRELLARVAALEVLRRVREEEPAAPSARLRQLSSAAGTAALRQSDPGRLAKTLRGELDWIVGKALEKDRTRRYQTANALARDLERYLEGEPVEACPPSAAYRMRKFVHKHRVWLGAAAAFMALLVAGVVVSAGMAVRASRAEQEARAVNDFLQSDLLAQASASNQARPGTRPDPDLKVRTALDRAAARIEGKFQKQPLVEASIRQTIGNTYEDLGLYAEGQRQVERALNLRRSVLGEKHRETLRSMSQLVDLYRLQGNYAQAEPLNVSVVEIQKGVLGADHPDTLVAMHSLAILYGYLNRYTEAEALFTKVFDAQRRVLGEQHSSTLETMHDLATLYQRQGNYAQAEPLYVKTVEVSRRVLGDEHPDTLVSMSGVAVVYQMQGKYSQAEELESRVLEAQRRILGDEHLFTLNTANHLASVFADQGKYEQAEALYGQTLDTQRRVLGDEHPETLITMSGLAGAYRRRGDFARAEPLYAKALEIQSRVLGEEYRDTRATMFNMGELYRLEGKHARAEPLFSKVLEERRRLVGAEHPETLATMNSFAALYVDERKYAQAEALAREALACFERAESRAWERYHSQSLLGASLAGQKKYAQAEPLLLAGYGGMREREATVPAVNRFSREEADRWIVKLYRDWGKPQKEAEWKERRTSDLAVRAPRM